MHDRALILSGSHFRLGQRRTNNVGYKAGKEIVSEDLRELTRDALLSRGLGRSYGDSSLPPPDKLEVASTVLADRILGHRSHSH